MKFGKRVSALFLMNGAELQEHFYICLPEAQGWFSNRIIIFFLKCMYYIQLVNFVNFVNFIYIYIYIYNVAAVGRKPCIPIFVIFQFLT